MEGLPPATQPSTTGSTSIVKPENESDKESATTVPDNLINNDNGNTSSDSWERSLAERVDSFRLPSNTEAEGSHATTEQGPETVWDEGEQPLMQCDPFIPPKPINSLRSAMGSVPVIHFENPQPLEPRPVLSSDQLKMVDATINALLGISEKPVRNGSMKLKVAPGSILSICSLAVRMMLSEPPLLEIDAPVNIVGDLHGQYVDLLKFLELGKHPPHSRYLFLGDYVDRGDMGVECCLLLLCYKLKYPDHVYMLRGNHECRSISRVYGFHEECKQRFGVRCWRAFNDVFEVLPFAAVVGDCIFCTHGGLSPQLFTLDNIRCIRRPVAIPDRGLLCDLVWSDPNPNIDSESGWMVSDRGVSFLFNENVVEQFLDQNGFELFVRAHQVVENGYEFFPPDKRILVTVFSAPNYCGHFDNAGAMMIVDKELVTSFLVLCPEEHRDRVASSVMEMEQETRSHASSTASTTS